jgi:nucleotide-binding universal stress UspA family protein
MRSILLPTDGSTPALVATAKAVEMAKEREATLIILKVIETAPIVDVERMAESSALMRPGVDGDGVEYAKELADEERVPFKVLIKEGPVVGEILRAVEEEKPELIVLGTSSVHGLNRLYLGSVAKAVVSQAPISVVVIKPTIEEIDKVKRLLKRVTEPSPERAVRSIIRTRQFKIGVYLFAIYVISYSAFILAGSYAKDLFRQEMLGMNVGTVTGITIILVTIGLAIGFNWYAGRSEEAS